MNSTFLPKAQIAGIQSQYPEPTRLTMHDIIGQIENATRNLSDEFSMLVERLGPVLRPVSTPTDDANKVSQDPCRSEMLARLETRRDEIEKLARAVAYIRQNLDL